MAYSAPDLYPRHLPIISTIDMASCGDVVAGLGRSAPASFAWTTANMVRFVPFYITEPIVVVKLLHYNGATAAGNNDIGIFDRSGNKIIGGANPAQAGTSAWQEHDITDTALNPGVYFVGLKNDGTTGTYFRAASLPYARLAGCCSAAGAAGGLASAYTYAAYENALIPIVAMALRTTI
jgi:hypothetical protein